MNEPTFEPWVGRTYGRGSRWGAAVLLLGTSHYREFTQVEPHRYTQYVVGRHVEGINDRSPYWTKLARTFECVDGRSAFWESVAFYNYVQEFMSEPGESPTARQMATAWAPFKGVVKRLQPDLIVATGKQLWDDSLALRLPPVRQIRLRDGRSVPVSVIDANGGAGLVGYINHPSWGGYSYRDWCPVVAALLREARPSRPAIRPNDDSSPRPKRVPVWKQAGL